ncbi:hypothetical protein CEXT_589771 [Caerostris extrusa]|uniref:Uncharacterized protein n=1 Tax=Caerostris extrusa TaxID=172846 RepID=A0AAV4NZ51_CAEEX|nr:hypothetical protein CEXT_589771 [Caerostris extrusa]
MMRTRAVKNRIYLYAFALVIKSRKATRRLYCDYNSPPFTTKDHVAKVKISPQVPECRKDHAIVRRQNGFAENFSLKIGESFLELLFRAPLSEIFFGQQVYSRYIFVWPVPSVVTPRGP